MTLRDLQPEPLAALDAVLARAAEVVDPGLLSLAQSRIDHLVAGEPSGADPVDARGIDACAVVDQMLIDVASLDDATVVRAGAHDRDGVLADLVMASYALEARTRLRLMSDRLLGGMG